MLPDPGDSRGGHRVMLPDPGDSRGGHRVMLPDPGERNNVVFGLGDCKSLNSFVHSS